jgi:hypothetical protein
VTPGPTPGLATRPRPLREVQDASWLASFQWPAVIGNPMIDVQFVENEETRYGYIPA